MANSILTHSLSVLALLVLHFAVCAQSFSISIAELHEECVKTEFTHEHLLPGENDDTAPTEVRVAFCVNKQTESESTMALRLVIDVTITEPDGKVLLSKEDVHEEDLTFFAHGVGNYTMCFKNDGLRGNAPFKAHVPEERKVAHVDVDFFEAIHLMDDPTEITIPHGSSARRDKKLINQESFRAIQAHISNLQKKLQLIQKEQKYIKKREARHAETVTSTNQRTLNWALLETAIFVGMNVVQVIIMRSAFATKGSK